MLMVTIGYQDFIVDEKLATATFNSLMELEPVKSNRDGTYTKKKNTTIAFAKISDDMVREFSPEETEEAE